MIDTDQIKDLEKVITYLNENDNPQKGYISILVKDPDALLRALSKVNKMNIKKCFASKRKKTTECNNNTYTVKDIEDLFSVEDYAEIEKKYTLAQLKDMYRTIYGRNPISSRQTKNDIVKTIRMYFHQIDRASAFGLND